MFEANAHTNTALPATGENANFFNYIDKGIASPFKENNHPFFTPALKTPLPLIQKAPADAIETAPLFDVITTSPKIFPITERAFPAGLSFSLGGMGGPAWERDGQVIPAEPFLFIWEATVQAHGQAIDEWAVGMLQTVKSWYVDVIWGEGAGKVQCTGNFNNLHDGFEQSQAWFKNPPSAFNTEGRSGSLIIEDSPQLQIPFRNPKKASEAFGYFNFNASFITYISAFNTREDAYNANAYKHLKSVRWSVAINGSFDGRDAVKPVVHVKGGGTTMENVVDAANEVPPVLGGPLAIDEIAKILQCWS